MIQIDQEKQTEGAISPSFAGGRSDSGSNYVLGNLPSSDEVEMRGSIKTISEFEAIPTLAVVATEVRSSK